MAGAGVWCGWRGGGRGGRGPDRQAPARLDPRTSCRPQAYGRAHRDTTPSPTPQIITKDSNVQVVAEAIGCCAALASGLRREYASTARSMASVMLEKQVCVCLGGGGTCVWGWGVGGHTKQAAAAYVSTSWPAPCTHVRGVCACTCTRCELRCSWQWCTVVHRLEEPERPPAGRGTHAQTHTHAQHTIWWTPLHCTCCLVWGPAEGEELGGGARRGRGAGRDARPLLVAAGRQRRPAR